MDPTIVGIGFSTEERESIIELPIDLWISFFDTSNV